MIRPATPADIPAIVRMTFDLARATRQPLPLSPEMVARFVDAVLASPEGFARVVDRGAGAVGMLVATVGQTPLSPVRIGTEWGWWCGPEARGAGLALLDEYEAWARGLRLYAIRISTPPAIADGGARRGLSRRGYSLAEQAWVKVL